MTFGQCRLDGGLAFQQPVQRGVEFVLVDLSEPEHFAETRCGGRRRQRAGSGELGGGIEDPANQQRKDQITTTTAIGAEYTVEADLASRAKRGGGMAVRQAADDTEGVAFGGYHGAALEHTAQALDVGRGPVGEIAQRALTNLARFAVALAQQDGGG